MKKNELRAILLAEVNSPKGNSVTEQEFDTWLQVRHFSSFYTLWVAEDFDPDCKPRLSDHSMGRTSKKPLESYSLVIGALKGAQVCKYSIGDLFPTNIYTNLVLALKHNEGVAVEACISRELSYDKDLTFSYMSIGDRVVNMDSSGWMVLNTLSLVYTYCDSISEVLDATGFDRDTVTKKLRAIRRTQYGVNIGAYKLRVANRRSK